MLKRFIKLKEMVYNELIALKLQALILTEDEFDAVKELVEALEIVEIGSRKLCRRKATLASADRILELMLSKLYKLTTDIGQKLYHSVESRITSRRNKNVATLQAFLEDHEFLDQLEQGELKMLDYADRSVVLELACYLYKRLFITEEEIEIMDNDPDNPGKINVN